MSLLLYHYSTGIPRNLKIFNFFSHNYFIIFIILFMLSCDYDYNDIFEKAIILIYILLTYNKDIIYFNIFYILLIYAKDQYNHNSALFAYYVISVKS